MLLNCLCLFLNAIFAEYDHKHDRIEKECIQHTKVTAFIDESPDYEIPLHTTGFKQHCYVDDNCIFTYEANRDDIKVDISKLILIISYDLPNSKCAALFNICITKNIEVINTTDKDTIVLTLKPSDEPYFIKLTEVKCADVNVTVREHMGKKEYDVNVCSPYVYTYSDQTIDLSSKGDDDKAKIKFSSNCTVNKVNNEIKKTLVSRIDSFVKFSCEINRKSIDLLACIVGCDGFRSRCITRCSISESSKSDRSNSYSCNTVDRSSRSCSYGSSDVSSKKSVCEVVKNVPCKEEVKPHVANNNDCHFEKYFIHLTKILNVTLILKNIEVIEKCRNTKTSDAKGLHKVNFPKHVREICEKHYDPELLRIFTHYCAQKLSGKRHFNEHALISKLDYNGTNNIANNILISNSTCASKIRDHCKLFNAIGIDYQKHINSLTNAHLEEFASDEILAIIDAGSSAEIILESIDESQSSSSRPSRPTKPAKKPETGMSTRSKVIIGASVASFIAVTGGVLFYFLV